jgi:hypothetical protein
MPVLTTANVTLVDRGEEGTYFDNDKQPYSPFQMDKYVIEAEFPGGTKIHRLLPKQSRGLWDSQEPQFVEQLKALFISQYIAGQRLVVE